MIEILFNIFSMHYEKRPHSNIFKNDQDINANAIYVILYFLLHSNLSILGENFKRGFGCESFFDNLNFENYLLENETDYTENLRMILLNR